MTGGPVERTAHHAGARIVLGARGFTVERRGSVVSAPLDDPADPAFLRLPRADLAYGQSVRRAAFDVWRDHLLAAVAAGREFETSYRAPRPLVTALTVLGGSVVVALGATLLAAWVLRPRARVTVEPTFAESVLLLLAVALVVGVIVVAWAAVLRAVRCRRGSSVRLGARGIRTRHGGAHEPLHVVAAAQWSPFVRCTRIVFADGRPDLWVPAEPGALGRLDLLVAALDDRLAAQYRATL